jgi:alpha-tubulin suppressor-like RCC1 family protein
MYASKTAPRLAEGFKYFNRAIRHAPRRGLSSRSQAYSNRRWKNAQGFALLAGAGLVTYYGAGSLRIGSVHAEAAKTPAAKEEKRDQLSSQHLQVKKSWENPGVYCWGSNSGRVAAPDSDDTNIKTPRRITYFDDILLRDLKLDRNFAAAVDEKGDLIQWGTGYSSDGRQPVKTLIGKKLKSIELSRDRIIALSTSGTVYSIPVSRDDQETGPKPQESSWIPFTSSESSISYRIIKPELKSGEKISSIKGGLEHLLLVTNQGRLFSSASSSESFPSRGQMGIPGLTWTTRPAGAYDQCHEITTLRGFSISQIAAGDHHSLAVDNQGRVFAFGDNSCGQLGFDYTPESSDIPVPSLLPINKVYSGTNLLPKVVGVAAGGLNSFFMVDATRIAGSAEDTTLTKGMGKITSDVWSCGQGIFGGLGNGRWTHVQGTPTKIKALSGLFEYDEKNNITVPIRMAHLSVGSTHNAAVMDNVTHVGVDHVSGKGGENETNWGADVVWWGGNEHYQLGTGKRNNVSSPQYIAPLDVDADREKGRREEHRFQITPRKTVKVGGRNVTLEQRVECGRSVTSVYSGV